eukprot:Phypoly_transcript_12339.p1 GENE.Phypoly_transcript_12339~~Phypoly_transcript_12339.p1  ORF type:complete len:371 (+),score=54.91 Phypoly_transcript_12339:159-1115(+)
MRSFPLPLADNSTDDLKPHAVLSFGSGISTIPAYFDSNDACAFSIVGRQLHLVDLGTFSTLHSVKLLQGTRKTASSVVYNNKEKRVTSFITSARNGANGVAYQLKVLEFQVRGGRLELYNSTFKNIDPFTGPWANSVLTAGEIDYVQNKIWYLDAPNRRLVAFDAQDLSLPCRYVPLPSDTTFLTYSQNVAYDFASMHAYVVSDLADGFVVHDIDLDSDVVEDSHVYVSQYPAASVHLNGETQSLFIGLDFGEESDTPIPDPLADASGELPYGEISHQTWRLKRERRSTRGEPSLTRPPILAVVSVEDFSAEFVCLGP